MAQRERATADEDDLIAAPNNGGDVNEAIRSITIADDTQAVLNQQRQEEESAPPITELERLDALIASLKGDVDQEERVIAAADADLAAAIAAGNTAKHTGQMARIRYNVLASRLETYVALREDVARTTT